MSDDRKSRVVDYAKPEADPILTDPAMIVVMVVVVALVLAGVLVAVWAR